MDSLGFITFLFWYKKVYTQTKESLVCVIEDILGLFWFFDPRIVNGGWTGIGDGHRIGTSFIDLGLET
jgi:hypothetical protein